MKQNIPPDPVAVGRLGRNGIVFTPDGIPDLVEQLWGRSVHVDLLALSELINAKHSFNKSTANVNIKIRKSSISSGFLTRYGTASPSAQIIGPEFADETGQHETIGLVRSWWNVKATEITRILLFMEFGWQV
jgi:hypothetical protein